METKGIPNLDAAEDDELADFRMAFDRLGKYCLYVSNARKLRLEGDIPGAAFWERMAERDYAELPEWARW